MHIFGLRVARKYVVYAAIFIITVYIINSIYLYFQVSGNKANFSLSLSLEDVRLLTRAGDDVGVKLILFDPVILKGWSINTDIAHPGVCLFLCHVIGPLIFAITYSQLKENPTFLSRLSQFGFTVTIFENEKQQYSHIFLLRHGSPLHIIVLDWAPANYWRQYALDGSPHHMAQVKQYITRQSLDILSVDRAFEEFETKFETIDSIQLYVPKDINSFSEEHKTAKFIPCNRTQASYFKLKYPQAINPEGVRFKHKAWKLLAKAKTLLDQLGIPFWISSGTLLGYFRECDIMPWAEDVDIGIFIEDYKIHLPQEFEKRNLKLTHKFGLIEDSYELSFREEDVKLDIFFFYTEGNSMWNGGTQARSGKKFKYTFPYFTMCWTEFLELKVRIPCQTQEYITSNYGSSWHKPVKTWDWKSSPPNVRENGVWPQEDWSKVIYVSH